MVSVTGVTMSPPIAPTAAASANDSMTTRPTSMPMSRAASRSLATARIARPSSVRSKKKWSATTMAAATPTIQRACGTKVAPRIRKGRSPVKAGSPAAFLPSVTMTPPLIRIDAPMVTMMRLSTSACRTGRTMSRSMATPIAVTATTVDDEDQRERQAGRGERRRAEHPAQHRELALGEVHRAGGVEDDVEAERDEGVDRADHEPGEEELEEAGGVQRYSRGGRSRDVDGA